MPKIKMMIRCGEEKKVVERCGEKDVERKEKDVENDDTLWPPLTEGKG